MPFAAVLTRASCRLVVSPPVAVLPTEGHIWERVCPVTSLRHIANLQAPNALRQGIPVLLYERSAASASPHYHCPSLSFILQCHWQNGQRLYLPRASAYSGDANWSCAGWLHQ